jgi:hypothetical protein
MSVSILDVRNKIKSIFGVYNIKLVLQKLIEYFGEMRMFLESFSQAIDLWVSFVEIIHDMALDLLDNLSEFDISFLSES